MRTAMVKGEIKMVPTRITDSLFVGGLQEFVGDAAVNISNQVYPTRKSMKDPLVRRESVRTASGLWRSFVPDLIAEAHCHYHKHHRRYLLRIVE